MGNSQQTSKFKALVFSFKKSQLRLRGNQYGWPEVGELSWTAPHPPVQATGRRFSWGLPFWNPLLSRLAMPGAPEESSSPDLT